MPVRREGLDGSSLRSRWLGRQLRGLREQRGLTIRFVAGHLGGGFADVAAHERGSAVYPFERVTALLDLYQVYEPALRDHMLGLARDAFRLRWEDDFHAPDLDVSTLDSLWLESVADRIRCYGATLVPELLRTPDYVEAVLRRESERPVSEDQLGWWARAYQDRQQAVERASGASVQAVVAAAVLRRPVSSSPRTRVEQHEHLDKAANGDRVQVRVLSGGAEYLPGMDGSFTVFDLPAGYPGPVAAVGHLNGLALHEGPTAQRYAQVFDRIWAGAAPLREPVALIGYHADEHTRQPAG